MEKLELLDEVIGLIESGWCQGSLARDALGLEVDYISPRAKSFCLVGAACLVAFSNPHDHEKWSDMYDQICLTAAHRGYSSPSGINDHGFRTPEQVIAFLGEVREKLLARERVVS